MHGMLSLAVLVTAFVGLAGWAGYVSVRLYRACPAGKTPPPAPASQTSAPVGTTGQALTAAQAHKAAQAHTAAQAHKAAQAFTAGEALTAGQDQAAGGAARATPVARLARPM
jgi:predicted lipid-binding transport protein (Tim44 family)